MEDEEILLGKKRRMPLVADLSEWGSYKDTRESFHDLDEFFTMGHSDEKSEDTGPEVWSQWLPLKEHSWSPRSHWRSLRECSLSSKTRALTMLLTPLILTAIKIDPLYVSLT